MRTPGFFVRRDAAAIASASDHVIATGMILNTAVSRPATGRSEYGAGFGQTALALARLGVNVDTVDISATFCGFVQQQADFFQVPLHPFEGRFGHNPRPGQRYDLIWFYESFHHCLDFQDVVRQLGEHLAEGGRVILGGEPIVEKEYDAVPYPWGVRLHSEVVAVVQAAALVRARILRGISCSRLFARPDSRAGASIASRRCSAGCTSSSASRRRQRPY